MTTQAGGAGVPARGGLGAVACGHPATACAAAEILEEGGNAFDAVIAAQFAACVAEPVLASVGGGGFLLAHPAPGAPVVYDFFVQTPRSPREASAVDFRPVHADFGTATQEFHIGLGAAATPGSLAGMEAVHGDLGSLPMARLVEPAARAAREGVRIERLQASIFEIVKPIYAASSEARSIYGGIQEGRLLRQSDLADTLEQVARQGAGRFYRGAFADAVARLAQEQGGHLSMEDLLGYGVVKRMPLSLRHAGATVLTNPPPSSGGILIGFGLQLLQAMAVADQTFGGPSHLAALAEIMAATNQARVELLAAAGSHAELDPALVERYRREVLGTPRFNRGTTHISVVDAKGNAAAMTLSNGEGCGTMIPGTGVMLNNMLGEEDINPDGFGNWPPDQRLTSMMAPTLVETVAGRRLALGSGGSNRIRTAIVQVISNLLDFGDSVDAAVRRPRLHLEGDLLSIEDGFDRDAVRALEAGPAEIRRWPGQSLFFGGVHVAELAKDLFRAAGDPRRGGVGRVVTARGAPEG
ncbi:MAG TPA: gamma-glutamyltransferase [Pseudomonadales bacterium]